VIFGGSAELTRRGTEFRNLFISLTGNGIPSTFTEPSLFSSEYSGHMASCMAGVDFIHPNGKFV
jgi:hypothetical protein